MALLNARLNRLRHELDVLNRRIDDLVQQRGEIANAIMVAQFDDFLEEERVKKLNSRYRRTTAAAVMVLLMSGVASAQDVTIDMPTEPVVFCFVQTPPSATQYTVTVDATPPVNMTPTAPPDGRCPPGSTHSFTLAASLFTSGSHTVAVTGRNGNRVTTGPVYTIAVAPPPPGAATIVGVVNVTIVTATTAVVALWDRGSNPVDETATWEMEIDAASPVPCPLMEPTATDRRCGPVPVIAGTRVFRLRGVTPQREYGEWSPPVTYTVAGASTVAPIRRDIRIVWGMGQ